jgi:dipeptidyl aminopeptidase/acylaminoacyl peptidase
VAAHAGSRLVWTLKVRGVRNIYVADGPTFVARQLTHYSADDGQELTHLVLSDDGRDLVYVRGGNHAANRSDPIEPPNPAGSTIQPRMQVWSIAIDRGAPRLVGDGDAPAIAPHSGRVAFVNNGQILMAPLDGTTPAVLVADQGISTAPTWSPDDSSLAFESDRDGQVSIAIFTPTDQTTRYLGVSSTAHDSSPAWSPDGKLVAFVRETGRDRTALAPDAHPWSIWVASIADGSAREVWKSGDTLIDSLSTTERRATLLWGAQNRLVFLSYHDKWPHLYSVSLSGGTARLLTPGRFMVEAVTLAPDRRSAFYSANAGADPDDGERRHIFRVPVDAARPLQVTKGKGIEWRPVITGDGKTLGYFGANARRPPLPTILPLDGRRARTLAVTVPDFPESDLVTPQHIVLPTTSGLRLHAQLFRANARNPRPALVFLHGGPAQQMLLGWHYDDYYAYAYAVNQYFANRGFVVLAVNYRLGIGYGHPFQFPERAGPPSSSEYDDVIAAGKYLQSRPDVDRTRIGIWGLSYGGYLTALALGRASDLFSAGVDIHGVHDSVMSQLGGSATTGSETGKGFQWRSPVLLIHADDDRNVSFNQTVDFERTLMSRGVPVESRVIPDDVHDFLLFRSWKTVAMAMTDFFERTLLTPAHDSFQK